ncbi:flavin-binding monooxygenase [Purpureocillium lavendulum]|uniref:Flavin-binding monooxygenase n=1 Tax=Purpureocillium lavendulum TaxID=1247861 RepID=A0AB34FU66_9HYPO|nr:flavin-binding monooxygenase [Purpureocillium lavendulum]
MGSAGAAVDDIDEHLDVVILGAGISGINAAHVLRKQLPHRSFTILEARSAAGGTWNFFRYPGFRSDSYMTTFGFRWHPWPHERKIAAAADIARYVEDAARADGTLDKVRFRHRVVACEWRDEDDGFWRLRVDADGVTKVVAANFVLACTGYYSYERALEAPIPGIESFAGAVVHPQFWPEDGLDYVGKKVVVVGSGATAFTIIPAMAESVASITMLQRSPSYAVSMPTRSLADRLLRLVLPAAWAHRVCWWKDIVFEMIATQLLLHFPAIGRWALMRKLKAEIPRDIDVDVHFNPRYDPFRQRLCMCPDGDFFKTLHRDNVEVVTDTVDSVTPGGIRLSSGRVLDADIIVTATGLYFEVLNGMKPLVNGQPVDVGSRYTWRGGMLEGLPNMGYVLGYVVQSWTPGADVMAKLMCRVIRSMEARGATKVVPAIERYKGMPRRIAVDASSNYFVKAADRIPKVTGQAPWYGRTHWLRDAWSLWFGDMDEGLVYSGGGAKKTA